jgi:hypothetical protein
VSDPVDELLGITRCARCGQRLEGEIECPLCSGLDETPGRQQVPKWIYITACFLTSPISLYALVKTDRLNTAEKILAFSGCLLWVLVYGVWF